MNLKDYQKLAKKTAVYPKIIVIKNPTEDQLRRCKAAGIEIENITWIYPLIGLLGEAGELANIMKKAIRDDNFKLTKERMIKIMDEKGDLSWYSSILDLELDIDPDLVLELNIDKLEKREKKDTVHDKGNRNE